MNQLDPKSRMTPRPGSAWHPGNLIQRLSALVRGQDHDGHGFDYLAALNAVLHTPSPDPDARIQSLVALVGEQLGARFAFYSRLEGDRLCSVARWNVPDNIPLVDRAEGHICNEVIGAGPPAPRILRHLTGTRYIDTDPLIAQSHAETFIGRAIQVDGQCVGSLCLVYQEDHAPFPGELDLIGVAAASIAIVEERRKAQAALPESEERYRQLVELLPDAVVIHQNGRYRFASPAAVRLFGATRADQLIGHSVLDRLKPDSRAAVAKRFQEFDAGAQPEPFVEEQIVRLDGSSINVEIRATAFNLDGRPAIQSVIRDISERKRAEEALRLSETKFRLIADAAASAIFIYRDERLLYVNPALERLSGYSSDELLQMRFWELAHPDFRELVRTRARDRLQGKSVPQRYEIEILRKGGEPRWVEFTAGLVEYDGRMAAIGTCFDITEHKRAEKLQRAVYQIARAADHAGTLDDLYREIHRNIASVMPADNFFIAVYDKERDLLSFPYFVDEVDRPEPPGPPGKTLTGYVLRTGQSLLLDEKHDAVLREQGEIELVGAPSAIWLGVPLRVGDKILGAMVVQHYTNPLAYGEREQNLFEVVSSHVAQAIERKSQELARARAEVALIESEQRYRNLVQNAPIGIYRTTPEGQILAANPALLHMLGYASFQELATLNLERDGAGVGYRRPEVKEMLSRDGILRGLEMAWQRADKTEIFIRENTQTVRDASGAVLYYDGTVEDITERRHMEEAERDLRALAEALRDTAALLNSTLEMDELLDRILANLGRVVPYDAASLILVEENIARVVRTKGYAERGADRAIRSQRFEISRIPHLDETARTGRPFIIQDVRNTPGWVRLPATEWIRSQLLAPIRAQGQLIGFIGVDSTIPGFFKESHSARLQAFADQAATALENARLLAETTRRADQFYQLYQTAQELASPRDLNQQLEMIVDRAKRLLSSPCGFIYLYDPAHNDLELSVEQGMSVTPGIRLQMGEGMAGRVAAAREPLIVDSYETWANRSAQFAGIPYRAVVQVPMIVNGELVGVLGVAELPPSERRFDEEDCQLLSLFATQAAGAARNAQLLHETQTRAQQLALLYDAGLTLNSVLEPRAQLEFLFKIAMRALRGMRSEYFTFDPAANEMVLQLGVDASGSDLGKRTMRFPADSDSGLVGWVYQNRVPLNIPDLQLDPRYVVFDPAIRSGLWAPVEHENQVRGVLSILSDRVAAFSPQDERLLVLFANQAAVALENARLYTSARQELEQRKQIQADLVEKINALRTLAEIDRQVMALTEPRALMAAVCDRTAELLRVPKVLITTVEDGNLRVLGSHGLTDLETLTAECNASRSSPELSHRLKELRSPIYQSVIDESIPWMSKFREREQVHAIALAPLRSGDETLGSMHIFDVEPREWSADEIELLSLLAGQAAIGLNKSRLVSELQDSLDTTTRLYRLTGQVLMGESFEQTAQLVTQTLAQALGADLASISLVDGQGQLTFQNGVGYPEGFLDRTQPRPDGMMLTAWATGRPVIVDDPAQLSAAVRELGVQASICLPLPGEEHNLGVLFAQYTRPHRFTERDVQVLSLYANQTALALRQARLLQQARQRAREFALVNQVAAAINQPSSLADVLTNTLRELNRVLNADAGCIAILEAGDQLTLVAEHNPGSDHPIVGARFSTAEIPALDSILRAGRPLAISGADDLARMGPVATWSCQAGIQSMLLIPLLVEGRVIGTIQVESRQSNRVFSGEEIALAETIAYFAASAIERARLIGEARRGLANADRPEPDAWAPDSSSSPVGARPK